MKQTLVIPLAIIMGGLIVATAVYLSMADPEPKVGDRGNAALVRPISTDDHILGNPAAPVKVIEYSDFYCEFCKTFDDTMHQIVASEGTSGKVAWVFRHFPLTEIHPNALKAARATECAAQVGGNEAFWKLSTALFKNQPVDPAQFGALASGAGITSDAFASCYAGASAVIDARIMSDRQNALDMGARGTPFSVILVEGKAPIVMDGAYPYDAVRQLIDEALAK